jgi:hypothetical protein
VISFSFSFRTVPRGDPCYWWAAALAGVRSPNVGVAPFEDAAEAAIHTTPSFVQSPVRPNS